MEIMYLDHHSHVLATATEETTMEFNIFYKKKKDWFIGHIQEYPDYESQGRTLDELRENLIEIYNDINEGLVPDAEPFQLMEVAI
jgi:predicted RNase H-like HicB family nuclease